MFAGLTACVVVTQPSEPQVNGQTVYPAPVYYAPYYVPWYAPTYNANQPYSDNSWNYHAPAAQVKDIDYAPNNPPDRTSQDRNGANRGNAPAAQVAPVR